MSESPKTQEEQAQPNTGRSARRRNGEARSLWLSRMSFILSGLALVSVGYRSISRHLADSPVPPPLQVAAESSQLQAPAQEDVAEAVQPQLAELAPNVEKNDGVAALMPRMSENLKKGLAALRIKRLVVTQAVEDREPVAVSEVVDAETPVIAFVEVASGASEDQQVVVTFEHEKGYSAGLVNLSVPGNKPRWRTWGRAYNIKQGGRWTAVVRDSRGAELGRTEFVVRRES
jgi:hypothetical protein